MEKQIFLLRHAAYTGGGDSRLSSQGEIQAASLARKLREAITDDNITIWTSTANRAQETASIIGQTLGIPPERFLAKDKLWSDGAHHEDYRWLEKSLDEFQDGILIIISHLEYVQTFPVILGFKPNSAGYAQGVMIQNGQCTEF